MAIIDKLKAALPDEINAALDTVQAASKLEGDLTAKQTQMRAALAKVEEARDRAALPDDMGGNAKEYDRLDKEAARLETELKKNLSAIREAGRRKADAEVALRKQRATDDIKNAKKFGKNIIEAAEQIAAGNAQSVAGWQKLHSNAERIALWRPELTQRAGGLLIRRDEIRAAIEAELYRISAPPPLDATATPIFPGGRTLLLAGSPSKLKSLLDVAKEAADYLVRRVEALAATPAPAPAPAQSKPQPAKVERDPDGLDDAPPTQPSGPTVSAAQVMATVGRVKMS
jgi:hypothetical protein